MTNPDLTLLHLLDVEAITIGIHRAKSFTQMGCLRYIFSHFEWFVIGAKTKTTHFLEGFLEFA